MLKSPLLRGNTTALSLSPLLATVIAAATETPASPQDETYHLPTVYVSASRLPADGGGTRNTVVLDSEGDTVIGKLDGHEDLLGATMLDGVA